jgi:hypothetical protein
MSISPLTKSLFLLASLFVAAPWASAQQVIPLWAKGAPGFESRRNEPEQHKDWWYKNIHSPSLTVFTPVPGKSNGTAVVVMAGGGHRELVFNPEGVEPAQYLASLGVTVTLTAALGQNPSPPTRTELPCTTRVSETVALPECGP